MVSKDGSNEGRVLRSRVISSTKPSPAKSARIPTGPSDQLVQANAGPSTKQTAATKQNKATPMPVSSKRSLAGPSVVKKPNVASATTGPTGAVRKPNAASVPQKRRPDSIRVEPVAKRSRVEDPRSQIPGKTPRGLPRTGAEENAQEQENRNQRLHPAAPRDAQDEQGRKQRRAAAAAGKAREKPNEQARIHSEFERKLDLAKSRVSRLRELMDTCRSLGDMAEEPQGQEIMRQRELIAMLEMRLARFEVLRLEGNLKDGTEARMKDMIQDIQSHKGLLFALELHPSTIDPAPFSLRQKQFFRKGHYDEDWDLFEEFRSSKDTLPPDLHLDGWMDGLPETLEDFEKTGRASTIGDSVPSPGSSRARIGNHTHARTMFQVEVHSETTSYLSTEECEQDYEQDYEQGSEHDERERYTRLLTYFSNLNYLLKDELEMGILPRGLLADCRNAVRETGRVLVERGPPRLRVCSKTLSALERLTARKCTGCE